MKDRPFSCIKMLIKSLFSTFAKTYETYDVMNVPSTRDLKKKIGILTLDLETVPIQKVDSPHKCALK
jgi:hypothetical protein